MAEQDRASFGVFPQLRRNRTRQDPEAAKNMPLDFLRGRVAGTLGLAGDIEGLGRMLIPNVSNESVLPNTEYFQQRLPLRNEAPASRGAENIGTLFASPAVLRTVAKTPSILQRAAQDFALAGSPVNVIKPKGGNWFDKNLLNSIQNLKKDVMSEEQLADFASRQSKNVVDQYMQRHNRDVAMNNWIENTYKYYVKNEMATPEDRVRQMFDRRSLDVNKLEVKYNQDIEKLEKKLAKAQELPPSAENNQRIAYIKRDIENKIEQKDIDISTARQTIGHDKELANEANYLGSGTRLSRQMGGYPELGMAKSEVGKGWENVADNLIAKKKAGTISKNIDYTDRYPWFEKVDPESMIYKTQGDFNKYTGMDHVLDILRQDLISGALTPEKLSKITVDQAIERAADFDRAAAKKMREAVLKNTEGFPTFKEYPEGYKWIELKMPEPKLAEGYSIVQDRPTPSNWEIIPHPEGKGFALRAENGQMAMDARGRSERKWDTPEEAQKSISEYAEIQEPDADALFKILDPSGNAVSVGATEREALNLLGRDERTKKLADALKYEGDTMGHCVGGYCPDVAAGNTRIFSLRDRRGEPHVTIEVSPNHPQWSKVENAFGKEKASELFEEFKTINPAYGSQSTAKIADIFNQFLATKGLNPIDYGSNIIQIKGKQNLRPIEKYDPYTQDFVRSGNFSSVGDLKNTGLYKADPEELGMYLPTAEDIKDLPVKRSDLLMRAKQAGLFPEGQQFLTRNEWEDILRKQYLSEQSAEAARRTQMGTPPTEGDIKGLMGGLEPEMARGGPVHLSRGTKAAEIVEATAEGIAKLFNKYSGKAPKEKEAMPLVLPRAAPKTSQEINEIAERVARQMIGEHVTPQGKTVNLAGRSKKEAERVKQLQFELTPTGTVAQAQVNKPQIGDVNVAFPGDQTISDTILDTLQGETINSLQQGGAKYGLGQRHLVDPEFWKSNIGPAQGIQGRIDDLYAKYMPERMVGEHLAMGPMSNNFAMHFADANLKALDWSKLTPKNVAIFDSHIADGYVIKKKNKTTGEVTTKHVKFPDWPGLAAPDLAFEAMQKNPELRKWFNNRMKTPDLTQPLGLPNGLNIEYAISEPAIRNLEINMTGLNTGILKPNAPVEPLGALHNTYTHRILGEAIGPREVLSPFTMSYPDATAHVLRTQRPSDFTGTIQKVFPHQVVDQQYLDEMGQYQDRVKQIVGYKKGGAVKKFQAGGRAKVVKSLADLIETYGPKSAKTTVIETIEAPAVVIPKGVSRVKEAVRASKGDFGARRVERAADEIANLEKMFTEDALREAFTGDNAKAVMTMNPADFEKYAAQLHMKRSVGPKAAELASQGDLSKHTMTTEEYLKYLRTLPEGFTDVPFLQISKQETGLPLMPYISGHEGRHRSRALAGAGQQKSLVRLMPNYELRESLPRRHQDEYIQALRDEMFITGNKVKPEKYFDDSLPKNLLIERPPIELPDFYAKGGPVHMAEGGSSKYHPDIQEALKAGRITPNQAKWMNNYQNTAGNAEIGTAGIRDGVSEKMMNYMKAVRAGEYTRPSWMEPIPKEVKMPSWFNGKVDLDREGLRQLDKIPALTRKAFNASEYSNTFPVGTNDLTYYMELMKASQENPDYQPYLDEIEKIKERNPKIGKAKGGEVDIPEMEFDDKESANLYKYAMKSLNAMGEQSGAGAGANIPLGGGNLNLGVNFNKLSTMPNQMSQTLNASYGKNINGIGVNANLVKPMDIDGVYAGMLNGSIPVGLGRLMLGLQAQKTPYGSGVTGYSAGYQGKVGDGMLSATINQPKNNAAGRSAQIQYQMPFAKGGAVEYNPAEIDTIAASLYEELYG